jgi:ubiquinone/menaquinone biosynthesis C-methylase UbiE
MVNPKGVLEEMKRVCTPSGKILVIEFTPNENKKDSYNHVEIDCY